MHFILFTFVHKKFITKKGTKIKHKPSKKVNDIIKNKKCFKIKKPKGNNNMNKRLLTITLAAIMAVSAGASVFADTTAPVNTNDDVLLIAENPNEETTVENNEITVMGTYLIYNVIVEDIKENTIITKVNGEETHFKMTEATIFNSKTKDIPTQGDALKIVVDGNSPAPAIIPAQYSAAAVLKTEENVYVGSFNKTDDGFVSADNTLALELEGTDFVAEEIEGKAVVVLYGTSTRSIPAITVPSQIIALNTEEVVEEDVKEEEEEVENDVFQPCYVESNYLVFDAVVEEIEEACVVTTVDEQEMVFNIFEETLFNAKTKDTLKKGDSVKFIVDGNAPTTYQLPVTYTAVAAVKTEENVFVGEFKLRDGALVSCDNTLALNLEGTDYTAKELKNNDLIVIYENTTKSIPAITTPSQVIVLRDNNKSFKEFLKEGVQAVKSVIDIYVNRIKVDFSKYDNVLPIIEDDFTLIPLRAVAEALNCNVDFDDATKTVTITSEDKVITLVLNAKTAKVNDKEVALDKEAKVINDRTMVPARFISESLGYEVDWDGDSKSVIID